MGHKGVSIRKPKSQRPPTKDDLHGPANVRQNERPAVQSLVKNNGNAFNRGGINPSAGSNQKSRKGQ